MTPPKNGSSALPRQGVLQASVGKFSIARDVKKGLLGDKFLLWGFVVSLIFLVLQIALILFKSRALPREIPFFYSMPWGNDILTSPTSLWIVPVLALFFLVVNFFISIYFFSENKFLTRVVVSSSYVIAFCSFWAVFKVITLLA